MHVPPYVNFTYATYPQTQNNSRVATMRYVRTAISELIDSSPGALDTLNELAAAINDDANFSTTINTALTNRVNIDFDNLSATGLEQLRDYIGDFENGTMTFPGSGNSISLTHNDAGNKFDITVALNDPTITVATTGAVTGSANATMTDLQNTSISIPTTLASSTIVAGNIDASDVNNIVNGLTEKTGVSNNDFLMIADSQDSFVLKKLKRSLVAPPALGEDLGFFAIAMS